MSKRILIILVICYILDLTALYLPEVISRGWLFRWIHYTDIKDILGMWNGKLYYIYNVGYLLLFALFLQLVFLRIVRRPIRQKNWLRLGLISLCIYFLFFFGVALILSVYFELNYFRVDIVGVFLTVFIAGLKYGFFIIILSPLTYVLVLLHFIVLRLFNVPLSFGKYN
jgi:hypothetical protein